MGESGSGKTTLLNILASLDKPTSGEVLLDGKDLTKISDKHISAFRRDNLGFVFQDFNLLDTLSCYENIALALTIQKVPAKEIQKRVDDVAEKLGITEILKKYPYQLSGGQKQRGATCRALITDPEIIFADEPTGALDYLTGKAILALLREMCDKYKMTVILITHNSALAPMADRVIHLKNGKVDQMFLN